MRVKRSRIIFGAAALVLGAVPPALVQAAPPVEVALGATADQVEERRGLAWSLTLTERSLRTLEGKWEGESLRFGDGEGAIEVSEGADGVWGLLWTSFWSEKPEQILEGRRAEFGAETGRVEIIQGEPAYCYGRKERLCVDGEVRAVLLVQVELAGERWELRRVGGGEAVQISRDGALFARVSGR